MMKTLGTLALPGICLVFAASAFADGVGYVTFENNTNSQLCVSILHSDGTVQKGNCIEAHAQHRFRFSSSDAKCKNKSRGFQVFKSSGGTKLGPAVVAGSFKFKGTLLPTANQSNKCALSLALMETDLQDLGFTSGWDSADLGESSTTVPIAKE